MLTGRTLAPYPVFGSLASPYRRNGRDSCRVGASCQFCLPTLLTNSACKWRYWNKHTDDENPSTAEATFRINLYLRCDIYKPVMGNEFSLADYMAPKPNNRQDLLGQIKWTNVRKEPMGWRGNSKWLGSAQKTKQHSWRNLPGQS